MHAFFMNFSEPLTSHLNSDTCTPGYAKRPHRVPFLSAKNRKSEHAVGPGSHFPNFQLFGFSVVSDSCSEQEWDLMWSYAVVAYKPQSLTRYVLCPYKHAVHDIFP